MTVLLPAQKATAPGTGWHRPLLVFAAAMAALSVVAAAGVVFDHRMLGGVPIWLKPLKFAISFGLYAGTLSWLLSLPRRARRTGWALGTGIVGAACIEVVLIVVQVLRGRVSHFDIATPFDSAVYAIMGAFAVAVFLATFVVAALLAGRRVPDRALGWSIRFGLCSALAGMALAYLMTTNVTAAQALALHGGTATTLGGHSVGAPDGGPAMPLTGWNTTAGDLRIPHFLGLHGLQVLPLLGLALTTLAGRFAVLRAERVRVRLLFVAAAGYGGLVALATWQALRGQALIHPDARTLGALAALVGAVALATVVVSRAGRTGSGSSVAVRRHETP